MPVVDASVVVAILADAEQLPWAQAQLSRQRSDGALWAPHLIDAEVGHALRRRVAAGRLEEEAAAEALLDFAQMPLRRIDHAGLLPRAWELRHNVSFYDGLYVALAEILDVPLLTLDQRLERAVGKGAGVIVLTPG